MAAFPTAHTLACLRIAAAVTACAASLATGLGGLTLGRAGFAPAGRQTKFHDFIASSILSDQPCLATPCNNAKRSAEYRAAVLAAVGPEDLQEVVARLLTNAKKGVDESQVELPTIGTVVG